MAMLVAPVVTQLRAVLEPETIVVGLALKELTAGLVAAFTVTVSVEVVEPAELVAVRV
jgi:flagellar biosynthesis protein FliR